MADDLLRLLFVCCDDALPRESRLVLALRTLCGFSTAEIALRLFTSEASVYKRLSRARDTLRATPFDLDTPPLDALQSRLPSVHAVLYLLFNEGYLSAHAEHAIRRELCDEAIRLATLLAEHPVGAVPETFALVALMHLHAARLGARCDGLGGGTCSAADWSCRPSPITRHQTRGYLACRRISTPVEMSGTTPHRERDEPSHGRYDPTKFPHRRGGRPEAVTVTPRRASAA